MNQFPSSHCSFKVLIRVVRIGGGGDLNLHLSVGVGSQKKFFLEDVGVTEGHHKKAYSVL